MSEGIELKKPDPLVDMLRRLCHEMFSELPALRSLTVIMDWEGDLNRQDIPGGIWQSRTGPVDTIEGVFGSIGQTQAMLQRQTAKAAQIAGLLEQRVIAAGHQLLEMHNAQANQEGRNNFAEQFAADGTPDVQGSAEELRD